MKYSINIGHILQYLDVDKRKENGFCVVLGFRGVDSTNFEITALNLSTEDPEGRLISITISKFPARKDLVLRSLNDDSWSAWCTLRTHR